MHTPTRVFSTIHVTSPAPEWSVKFHNRLGGRTDVLVSTRQSDDTDIMFSFASLQEAKDFFGLAVDEITLLIPGETA